MRYGGIALTLIAGLAACGEPTQLYITHNTVLGLDAAVDTNRQAGRLLFGYDRQFIALAPRSVPRTEAGEPDCDDVNDDCREAMAALSCNEVEVRGIFLTRFKDRLATGTAAKKAAEKIVEVARNAVMAAENVQEPSATTVVREYAKIAAALFDCWESIENGK